MHLSSEVFWKSSLKELKRGYVYDSNKDIYICLVCGHYFEKGVIYQIEDISCEAEKAIKVHIEKKHGSVFNSLIDMDKKYTGLSDIQRELLVSFYNGMDDSKISKRLGISSSTVRNHRFRLKEKAKQAKVFLALMELMETRISASDKIIDIHKSATMIDERYAITKAEQDKAVGKYFDSDGKLLKFPKKEKERVIVLMEIARYFDNEVMYREREINKIIEEKYEDYVLIRRYMIEYGLIDRKPDGSAYWVVF